LFEYLSPCLIVIFSDEVEGESVLEFWIRALRSLSQFHKRILFN